MNAATTVKRVAVLGAGGIGKHHAKWWHLEGAQVCAFLGRTPESVERSEAALKTMFPFAGTGYTDLERLLQAEKPDIVDVCSPTELHYRHATQALRAGCSVLCEKPFVYDAELTSHEMLAQAKELVGLARRMKACFGVCTQYVVAARLCLAICPERFRQIESYRGYLVSPTRGRAPNPSRTWVDLAPHMLGVLQVICPDGRIDWQSLDLDFEEHRARARFRLLRADGSAVACDVHTDHTDSEPKNVRQLTFNGYTFDIGGFNDANGVFNARIQTPDGSYDREDAMRLLIRSFRDGKAEVPGRVALHNLEWMLRVLDAAEE